MGGYEAFDQFAAGMEVINGAILVFTHRTTEMAYIRS